ALTLYSEILDRIEEIEFAVFAQRATVSTTRRLQVAAAGFVSAPRARARHQEV
ncbi:phytoene synthase, partial [Mycobacterium sp. ITM-2017-0098]